MSHLAEPTRPTLRSLLLTSAAAALAVLPGAVSAGTYKFTDLGTLGGRDSGGAAVNAAGRIAGYAEAGFSPRAVIWKGKEAVSLGRRSPAHHGHALALNDADDVVGKRWDDSIPDWRATLWRGGKMIDLGGLAADAPSEARAINACGEIVGMAYSEEPPPLLFRPVRWTGGTLTDLGTLGGTRGLANGINGAGDVVGESQLAGDKVTHATLWRAGAVIDLGGLRGDKGDSTAAAINEHGVIVGSAVAPDRNVHAARWQDGNVVDLGTLGGLESHALGLNNAGDVVGHSQLPAAAGETVLEWRATLWPGGGAPVDLNTWLDAATQSEWVLRVARGINDQGVITGVAENRHVALQVHAFRLAPVTAETKTGPEGPAPRCAP